MSDFFFSSRVTRCCSIWIRPLMIEVVSSPEANPPTVIPSAMDLPLSRTVYIGVIVRSGHGLEPQSPLKFRLNCGHVTKNDIFTIHYQVYFPKMRKLGLKIPNL